VVPFAAVARFAAVAAKFCGRGPFCGGGPGGGPFCGHGPFCGGGRKSKNLLSMISDSVSVSAVSVSAVSSSTTRACPAKHWFGSVASSATAFVVPRSIVLITVCSLKIDYLNHF
jgi:hypothetical protein